MTPAPALGGGPRESGPAEATTPLAPRAAGAGSGQKSTSLRRFEATRVHGNRHGYRGVEWDAARQMFRARIEATPETRGRWLGRWATAEEAARAYDEAAREEYGAEAFLNFPGDGERQVQPSRLRDGECPQGHRQAEFRAVNARGDTVCRECNRLAVRRYQARRKEPLANVG